MNEFLSTIHVEVVSMASASTPITRDDLTLFNQGDRSAFERLFRSQYDSLVASASAELDDPAAAPRIVESTFFQAWQQRASFAQPGELIRFLQDTTHQIATRDRNRRASLRRFQEHEGGAGQATERATAEDRPTADQAWAALVAVMDRPAEQSVEDVARRRDASRHGTASHMAKVGAAKRDYRGMLLMLGVGVVVIAAIYGLMRVLGAGDPARLVDSELERSEARTVTTRAAQRANVPLADGSAASLGPDTQLRIAQEYGKTMRVLGLNGTASFTVAESEQPFFVRAGAARIRATGTVFDVSSFVGQGTFIRVRQGSVSVTARDSTVNLLEGEVLAVMSDSSVGTPDAVALDEAMGWTDGQFVMVDRPMRDVPTFLMRWYGIQVTVADTALLERRVSVRVPLDSTSVMISALEEAGQARYTSRGGERIFRDATM